ncbi:MAG: sel1 repeat family protein [Helicobacteraceae bacterium]|jgi:TPR repeat protein|nr:sel1 repeat family protein [Helicobacteraceae bacterium]
MNNALNFSAKRSDSAIRVLTLFFSLCVLALSAPKYLHIYGEYDKRLKPYPHATWLYNQAVERNNTDAAFDLASFYRRMLKDYPKAIELFTKVYEQSGYKDGGAAYSLGLVYKQQLEDYENAEKWYKIAYKLGDKDAAFALGILYADILKDYPKTIEWYKIAHNKGDKNAAYSLGLVYKQQLQDYENAEKWYKIAYNQGDYKGIQALSVLYHDQYNDKVTAGAYQLGLIGKYSKEEIIGGLKSDWNLTSDELKQAYKLHQTLDLPKHYNGGID